MFLFFPDAGATVVEAPAPELIPELLAAVPVPVVPLVEPREPFVTLHKNGRKLLVKPGNIRAADILRELNERMLSNSEMKSPFYYGLVSSSTIWGGEEHLPSPAGEGKVTIKLWPYLYEGGDNALGQHPYLEALRNFGVEVRWSATLKNWMQKAIRKSKVTLAPFPVPPAVSDCDLIDRVTEGATLRCIKSFWAPNSPRNNAEFESGKHYMVVSTGEEGADRVVISTTALQDRALLEADPGGKSYAWTMFDGQMEEYFDDSEDFESGPTVDDLYPERVAYWEKKIRALPFAAKLYEHVIKDAARECCKSGNGLYKDVRMAKSSEVVAVACARGFKKVYITGPKNARRAWKKEFQRVGIEDYVLVGKLSDMEKPARFYFFTHNFLKDNKDALRSERNKGNTILHRRFRSEVVSQYNEETKKTEPVTRPVETTNKCPFCDGLLVRFQAIGVVGPQGVERKAVWSTDHGYICRNKECNWKELQGSALSKSFRRISKPLAHKGGYVDYSLAAHRDCADQKVRGRLCTGCGVADDTWQPPRYKRLEPAGAAINDEIHNCKSGTTQAGNMMFGLRGRFAMGLSGTPYSGTPEDMFYPLVWSSKGPSVAFPYSRRDLGKFRNRFIQSVTLEKTIGQDEDGKAIIKKVRKVLPFLRDKKDWWKFTAPLMVRRNREDALYKESLDKAGMFLPKVKSIAIPTRLHPAQAALLLEFIKDFRGKWEKMLKDVESNKKTLNSAMIISQMTAMKIVATCPEMLNDKVPGTYDGPPGGFKPQNIYDIVSEKVSKGEKVLVLTDFRKTVATLAETLKKFNPIAFDPGWNDEKRDEMLDKFTEGSDSPVLIGGTRAIKESIELGVADTVVSADLLWGTAFQTQAWGRIMAPMPYPRTCEIYMTVAKNSLDEHIYNVFYNKLRGSEQALDRKLLSRRVQKVDIRWFVERVLEEEENLMGYLRESEEESIRIPVQAVSQEYFERVV
jgi:hypothetical protein